MSLSHLGRFSDPVFDAALPVKPMIFPVARRIASHAARSLFAGKLLFPVAIPGKEGQHCFAADPRRLFRMPRTRQPAVSVFSPVISRMNLAFPPTPSGLTASRQRLETANSRFSPRPVMLPRAVTPSCASDLSIGNPESALFVRFVRSPAKGFREPMYFQKCLISRIEISRLRRMAPESDWHSPAKPQTELTPASPPPDVWTWFALSAQGCGDRIPTRQRAPQAGTLAPPRPRLLYPTDMGSPAITTPVSQFRAHGRRDGHAWRPACIVSTGRIPLPPLQRRLPFAELVSGKPSPAAKDRHTYILLYIDDSLSIPFHPGETSFSHERGRLRPALHSTISPALPPAGRLAVSSATTNLMTSIVTNIARSRLADIRGTPGNRMLRKWPHAAFHPLRRLLFHKPFSKRFDFQSLEPMGFRVITSRNFSSLRPFSGSLDVAKSWETVSTRAKPGERRSCRRFDHSPKDRLIEKMTPNLPDARATALRISAVHPSPVMFLGDTARKSVRQPLGMPARRPFPERAFFAAREKPRAPFKTSLGERETPGRPMGLRFPVPVMQLTGMAASPRGPRPPTLPRRLPPAGDPERMIRIIVSHPRRSHSTKHYLLTLESLLAGWKQLPQPRRQRIASSRDHLAPRSILFAREVSLPEEFKAVSPIQERVFLSTGVQSSFPTLRDADLQAARRIAHDRLRLPLIASPLPATVAGARFLDAPDWIRPARQAKMKIRYWPTFYEFPPAPPAENIRISEIERIAIPPAEPARNLTRQPGQFGVRRRDRTRGPYSMRRPKRWLLRADAISTGIPDSYRHDASVPTTTPSRLDSAERFPPAFMGPAFRSPWRSIVVGPDRFRRFTSERAVAPSPERLPHCRASTRPSAMHPMDFQEIPMPRVITTARLSPLSSPVESLEIQFGQQPYRPVGPVSSCIRCEPPIEARLGSLRRVEAFVELQPEFFANEFQEAAAGAGFFIRDLLCCLVVAHGDQHARWRSLFFPYRPEVGDISTSTATPIEPASESMSTGLLDTSAPLALKPGILSLRQECEEPSQLPPDKASTPFAPDHPGGEPVDQLPVLSPDVFGFDILEAPDAPADEWDFSTSMFVPFIPAPLPKALPRADRLAGTPPRFSQAHSESVPPIPWPRRQAAANESFPSLEQPSDHTVINPGRWKRQLQAFGGFRIPLTPFSTSIFSAIHRLDLPALPAGAFQALHIVDLAPAVITCHSTLNPVAPPPAILAIPAPSSPRLALDSSAALRFAALPYLQMSVNMTAGRFRLHEMTGLTGGRRISFRKREFGYTFSPAALLQPHGLPRLELKDRRLSSKFKTTVAGKAAVHLPAIPDWLELSAARPACRPPTGL